MRSKIFQLILFITLIVNFSSCETDPTDFVSPENYYNNQEQLNFALTGVYNSLGSYGLYQYTYLCQLGMEADEGFYRVSNLTQGPQVYNYTSSNVKIESLWQNLYIGIENANLLLENIDKPKNMDEAARTSIRGQALFLRAYFYYMLAVNFGDVPLVLESTKSANYTKMKATPVKQVYEQVVKDMITAEQMVPAATEVGFGGRISKSAVRGLLARVYLHMAGVPVNDTSKYEDARKWAKMVIDSHEHALEPDYTKIFINYAQDKYDIKESIWEVEFWGNGLDLYREMGHVGNVNGIYAYRGNPVGTATGLINVTNYHFRKYEPGDLRRDWNCAPFRYNRNLEQKIYWRENQTYNRSVGKFRREYETLIPKSTNGTPQNFPLLRYADILLMFAEAENEINGPTAEAIAAVQAVRDRAFGNLMPNAVQNSAATISTGITKDEFRKLIQDERMRELCFECMRKHDLIRWGIFIPTMRAVAADFEATGGAAWSFGALAFKNAEEKDIFFPIPIHDTSLNQELLTPVGE